MTVAKPLEEVLLEAYETPEVIPESEAEQAPLRERFRITDDSQANWAIRKIAQVRAEYAKAQALAGQEMDRISRWLAEQQRDAERTERFFTGLLREYCLPRFAADPRLRTIKLPSGKVQIRTQQPEFRRDEPTLVQWLKDHGMTDLIETRESSRWADIKAQVEISGQHVVTRDGEVVEGVEVIPRPPSFKVVTEEAE